MAVIIILAIIALIATPIILDVVDDARISAGRSEANMILGGINNYCATEEIKVQMNSEYEIICKSGLTAEDVKKMVNLGNAEILEIEYSDRLTWLKVKSNGHIYSYQDNAMIEEDLDKPEAKYAVGDLLKVQVSDSETQNIYVLEVNGNEIIGILDRNLPGGTVAWISEEDFSMLEPPFGDNPTNEEVYNYLKEIGPITANNALNERTSTWNNVTNKYLPKATTLLKLTKYYEELEASEEKDNWETEYFIEVEKFKESIAESFKCNNVSECREATIRAGGEKYLLPEWTTINLMRTGDNKEIGYWTTTVDSNSNFQVTIIQIESIFPLYYLDFFADVIGIRPIIHISQSNVLSKLEAPEYVNPDDVE